MSSIMRANQEQPPDFIKADPIRLVHSLRQWELELIYEFNLTACCILNGNERAWGSSASPDPHPYEGIEDGKNWLANQADLLLRRFYHMLRFYYEYPEGYIQTLLDISNKKYVAELPLDYDSFHDAFWGSDPTRKG